MSTMKVNPWGEGQGDFVIIEAADFDPEKHTEYDEQKPDDSEPQKRRGRPRREN